MSGVSSDGSAYFSKLAFGIESVPDYVYVALATQQPSTEDDGSQLYEPDDVAYARVQISTGSGSWAVDNTNAATNVDPIVFPTPATTWGSIASFVLCTAATDGDIICWGEFETSTYISQGVALTIPAGGISFGFVTKGETV